MCLILKCFDSNKLGVRTRILSYKTVNASQKKYIYIFLAAYLNIEYFVGFYYETYFHEFAGGLLRNISETYICDEIEN